MEKKPAQVGEVTHVYSKIGVAIVKFSKAVSVGETLHFKGHGDDFSQAIDSMQINHQQVEKVKKGDEAGIKVGDKVHEGDLVYLEE
jgi:putative protease